jgi:hypothetical protein
MIVLIGLVGRLVIAARLRAVGLPTATGVSLVSADVLLSVGAGTLALSLVLGLAAVLSLYAIRFALARAGDRALLTGYIVLAVTLEAILVVITATVRSTWPQRLVAWGAGLVAAVLLVLLAQAKGVATRTSSTGKSRSFREPTWPVLRYRGRGFRTCRPGAGIRLRYSVTASRLPITCRRKSISGWQPRLPILTGSIRR